MYEQKKSHLGKSYRSTIGPKSVNGAQQSVFEEKGGEKREVTIVKASLWCEVKYVIFQKTSSALKKHKMLLGLFSVDDKKCLSLTSVFYRTKY